MEITSAAPSRRTKLTVWLALLLLAAIAWTIIVVQIQAMNHPSQEMAGMEMGDDMAGMAMNQGMAEMAAQPESLLFFLPLWVVMMVAMMFPAVAPVVSFFDSLSLKRREAGLPAAPTWLFLAGYLAVWSLFGLGAYLLSLIVPAVGMMATGLRMDNPLAAGFVLIVAGLYQLSPLKQVCLKHCRSPLSIILHGWRDGPSGAFRMGFVHGAYCLGCCWGLMLVLFAVGLMNLLWMIILTIVIFAEKVLPYGSLVVRLTALALILFGQFTLVMPWLNGMMG
jgi:predicted metal-binding membrane protein